jgi:hypothetical protein
VTYRDTLRALAAEKQAELVRLEAELAAGRAYLRFLTERIEAAEKRCGDGEPECTDPVIVIRRLIREAGQPLYIDDILRGLDRPLNRDGREEIRQLLLSWVRREEIFTRPRPGVFGLVELEGNVR